MPDGVGHPLVGRRIPDAELSGGRTVFAALRAGRGVLLDLRGTGEDGDGGTGDGHVDVVRAEPVPNYGAARLLVRPDGYVVFADPDSTNDEGLLAAFETWFGGAPVAAWRSVSAA